MGPYNFIKKAYGSTNLDRLKLYLSIEDYGLFKVTRLTENRIDLLDNNGHYRFIPKDYYRNVGKVSFLKKLSTNKTILHLGAYV